MDAAIKGKGISRDDADTTPLLQNPNGLGGATGPEPAVIVQDDGSIVVDFNGPQDPPPPNLAFTDNLTSLFTSQRLQQIGNQRVEETEQDDRSRDEWKKTYARGLNLLGLNYEDRTDPWEGACGAFHPMLLESVIRFNAQEMMDIFPPSGPVMTEIVGRITDAREAQAKRISTDMNWLATEKITGYRTETDMMLFNLPLAGTTFRKFGFDKARHVPWAEYVLPEHLIMPYTAASLDSSPRYAVVLPKTTNWIAARMKSGAYRDVAIGPATFMSSEIKEQKDKIEGKSNTNQVKDYLHRLYECHVEELFEEDPLNDTGLPVPYTITVDKDSRQVLCIKRNWREGDESRTRQMDVVQHKYMPGFGPYGIGLINILGGLTESATSILRQLIDAGTLKNLPAGFKAKTARIKDDSTPIGPGEWRDVDVSGANLKESFVPLPYGEPSTVLYQLLGNVVDEGRRIGSVADMKITDMTGQNMPVGTTLAIIERSMKVMSAVQQRLYESFRQEYKVLAEIIGTFMGDIPYAFELEPLDQGATRAKDYSTTSVSIIPVADPNATTMAQRVMTVQAIIQMSQGAPTAGWNLNALYRDAVTILGSDKADLYLPPPQNVKPADPITENMNILNSRPVKAGIAQDHAAHITVHMSAAQDPKILAMLQNNPAAPSIQAAMTAHVLEHMAFEYRQQIEQQLGFPLPDPDQPLPDDLEYQVSRLAAAAAQKLLQKDTADAQQAQIQQNLQDPVVINESRALDIKDKDADTKRLKVLLDQKDSITDKEVQILLTLVREMAQTERTAMTSEAMQKSALDDNELRQAELAADLGDGIMGHIAKLLIERSRADSAVKVAAARPAPGGNA